MVKISVQSDIERIARALDGFAQRQIPFAAVQALNGTVQAAKEADVREMRDVFDRPTPYTLSGVYAQRATKARLEAEVGLKDFAAKATPAAKFLQPQIAGGVRRPKRFEVALRRAGVLPPDMLAVPGEGARVDAFGNLSRGQLVQILAYFRAFPEAGYRANLSAGRRAALARGSARRGVRGFAYFVGRPGGGKLPLGVWQRVRFGFGSALKPVLIFVPGAVYAPIYDFEFVARKTVEREFPRRFEAALASAWRTAR